MDILQIKGEKTKMKRLLAIALIIVLSITVIFALSSCGELGNPYELEFFPQDDGTYVVSAGKAKYLSNSSRAATALQV